MGAYGPPLFLQGVLELRQRDLRLGGGFAQQGSDLLHHSHLLFNHFIGDGHRLIAQLGAFALAFLLAGDIAHNAEHDVVLVVVNDGFSHIFFVFGQIVLFLLDGHSAGHHAQVIGRVQQPHDGGTQDIGRRFEVEQRAACFVDLLYAQIFIQHKNGIGRIVDDITGEIMGKTITVKTEYDIWKALQGNGILTEGCQLLSFKVNEETHLIDLDFNAATGEYIRSMGTTGEIQIIGCIINTYLETYDCDGIKLTEEGKVLQTSHGANYDGYSGIMSF